MSRLECSLLSVLFATAITILAALWVQLMTTVNWSLLVTWLLERWGLVWFVVWLAALVFFWKLLRD